MGYRKDVISGISWVGALRASNRLIVSVKLLFLARLLTPDQFGIFGVAALVLAFLEIITETGINVFLIQENKDLSEYVDTAWVVSIGRGILISLLLFIAAPFIARFFNSPGSYGILALISVVPLVRGFINPSQVKFQKELYFHKEFFYRFVIYFADASAAIFFALKTHSPISLVAGMIFAAVFEVFLSHLIIKPHPKISFESEKIKKVINRGKWITMAGFFNYVYENVDDASVGKILSTTYLGYYQMAYRIFSLPLSEVSDVVNRVIFPVYVKMSGDMERLKKAYLKSLGITAILVLPISLALFIFPDFLVRLVLGSNWIPVVPVVRVMAFFGLIRIITESSFSLFLSVKKQEYVTATTLIGTLSMIITIIPFVKMWGIVGAALSALIGSIVTIPVVWYYFRKI